MSTRPTEEPSDPALRLYDELNYVLRTVKDLGRSWRNSQNRTGGPSGALVTWPTRFNIS